MKHRPPLRRILLGTLALAALAAPPIGAGCAASFAPISQLQGLRVLGVVPRNDSSYVAPCQADDPACSPGDVASFQLAPGASVTFDMSYEDTYGGTPLIVWLGGCVNPAGDEYYGCYPQLLGDGGGPDVGGFSLGSTAQLGMGPSFTMSLPRDLISSRKATPGLPRYGIAFAFFLACAGRLGPAAAGATAGGLAGSFPVGCFDDNGATCMADGDCGGGGCVGGICQCASDADCGGSGCFEGVCHAALGADRFVPGYTQVYAFAAGYTNKNPPVCDISVTVTGSSPGDGGAGDGGAGDGGTCLADVPPGGSGPEIFSAAYCDVPTAARNGSGCGKTDAFAACPTYDVTVQVPDTVADFDPQSGVYETVWVDYFADQGDIDSPTLLVSDSVSPTQGPNPDGSYPPSPGFQVGKFVARWSPPPSPGADAGADAGDAGAPPETATIWAVVHDSRGGSAVWNRKITLSVDGGS